MSDTQNQWIPVSERLPEKTVEKLVLLTNGEQCVAFIGGVSGKWTAPGIGIITHPTHWMDLPKPPAPPKPTDPFEVWWDTCPKSWPVNLRPLAREGWNAAKEHYAKPLPDFETWWNKLEPYSCKARRFNDVLLRKDIPQAIWNAAQGKPEA